FERASTKAEFPADGAAATERFTLDEGEAAKLIEYLRTLPELIRAQRGEKYTIVRGEAESRLLEGDQGQMLVRRLLEASTQGRLEGLLAAAQLGSSALEHLGAAARQLYYRQELDALIEAVPENPTEPTFQAWVKRNYWVFGTEYVDRPDLRDIARDCQI